MKYLTEERFIVQSNSKESQRNYAEGWERTFGEKEPTTPVAAKRLRILQAREDGWRKHLAEQGVSEDPPPPPERFTCDDCAAALTCEYAFDDYNTQGDCLAEK